MADYNVDFLEDRFPEEWLAAMRADVRRERVSLVLSRGGSKNDADIIQNSLYINHKVMGSKFDLGTCCTSEMGVSFIDENAIDTNYGGVLATVVYSLYIGADDDGSEKWYFSTQGPFIIDGQKARREGKVVTLKAYDILSNFDYEMPKQDIPEFENLYAAVEWLCDTVPLVNGVRFGAMPAEEFNKLPNADIVPDFSSGQIVSCRDALMWIAQATGTCVYYGRKGITFKQYKYTGNMAYDREITVQERERIEFTDTRTYCAYLTAETDSGTKIYSNVVDWDESWDPKYIKTGGLNLPKNPIISGLTQQQQEEVNKNILQNMSYPTRYVKMSGDVDFLLEPLDCTAFTGGSIDIRNMIISPVTEINWKYRATGKIVCTNVDEYTDTLPDEVTPVLLSMAEEGIAPQSETSETVHSPVYSQSEKALRGRDSATKLIGNFGKQYVFKWTNPYYLEAFDGDGKEMFKLSVLPFSVEKGNSHITLGSDYIEIKNAETRGREFSFYIHENGQTRITDSSGNDVFSIIPAGGLMEYKVGSQSFQVWLNTGEIKMNGKTVWAPWMA